MTFDDGILNVFRATNTAANGAMPVETLALLSSHYFSFDNLGVTRYYTALMAHQQIELVAVIPDWHDIIVTDIVTLEDGLAAHSSVQFRVAMVQAEWGDDGLRTMRLSLERVKGWIVC